MLMRTEKSQEGDWRAIRCSDVQWDLVPGVSGAVKHGLYRQCSPAGQYCKNEERWDHLTLGQLADFGERWWRGNGPHIGPVTIAAIKLAIDAAAAGYDVTRSADAYIPQPFNFAGKP